MIKETHKLQYIQVYNNILFIRLIGPNILMKMTKQKKEEKDWMIGMAIISKVLMDKVNLMKMIKNKTKITKKKIISKKKMNNKYKKNNKKYKKKHKINEFIIN